MHALRVLPSEEDLGGGPGTHGQLRADRDRVAQAAGTFRSGDTHTVLALTTPQLGGLAGDVSQTCQDGPCRSEQAVLACCGRELGETRTEHEAALHVAGHEAVVFEGYRKAVRGRSGQPGAGHQASEGGRAGLECGKHQSGFVENSDSTRVVHMAILSSQIMGCKR